MWGGGKPDRSTTLRASQMETRELTMIAIAALTLISSWSQFWLKERLLSSKPPTNDHILAWFKSGRGLLIIALTGVVSVASMCVLAVEVLSAAPVTRFSCFSISVLTVMSVLNMLLIQSLFTLKRLAHFNERIDQAEMESITYSLMRE